MADNSSNSSYTECSVYDTYPYVIVAVVSSGSAIVSALCCIFVIGLIFLLKKHYFFIQRLVLYHCLAALFRAFALILRFHRLGYRNETTALKMACIFSAFMDQVTLWYLTVDFSVITFTLVMTAIFHKNVARLEGLFIVLIFIFPLTFNWIPFINSTYGRNGASCWIRNLNYEDCTEYKFGYILQNVLWEVPSYIFLAVMIPVYLIVMVFVARQRCCRRGKDTHDPEMNTLRKSLNEEVWPLLFFPLGALVLNLFPLASQIHDTIVIDNPLYELSILRAIFSPLQGGYIALVYTLDRDTLRRLTYSSLMATLCKRRDVVREYPAEACGLSDSVISSEGLPATTNYMRYGDSEKQSLLRSQC